MVGIGIKGRTGAMQQHGRKRSEADMGRRSGRIASGAHDPGCVKTHKSVKREKYNSPARTRGASTQNDLTLAMLDFPRSFCARAAPRSFHTTKTLSGQSTSYVAVPHNAVSGPRRCGRFGLDLRAHEA